MIHPIQAVIASAFQRSNLDIDQEIASSQTALLAMTQQIWSDFT
jgi:hypothetical protein